MPTVQQLPQATIVNLTDEIMLDQGGTSVAATVAQVLDAQPLGTGLVRSGDTIAADVTVLAPLASPALSGTPSAPTPPAGDNSTLIATTAFVMANAGTVTLTGDVTGIGAGTIATALAPVATPGTYEKVTIDATGRVLSGSALVATDISAALGFTPLAGNQTITLSGDVSGNGTTAITATLPAVVVPGTYASVTVDAKGRVTAGSAMAATDFSAGEVTATDGTTARTLAARAGDRINVLDYGADPTGASDSAAAFTAAMDAIASGSWGVVFVPRGSYQLASAVNQPAGRSVRVVFDDGANITGSGYLGVDCVESHQGAFRQKQVSGGWFGFAPSVGSAANPGFASDYISNTPQNSLSMRVGWDRRYTNTNIYGKVHSGIDIAEQRIHSWPNLYDNSSGWGLWEVIESTTLDEDTAARAGLSTSAELSETDVVNNGPEAGWTWHPGLGNAVQGMSIDPWGQNGNYGGHILFDYGSVGGYDGSVGGLNQRWFSYPAVFSAGNPTVAAGTIVINGTTVNVTAGETLASIASAINTASIANVRAAVSTWGGVVARLVIYSTVASDQGSLTLSGTALGALGIGAATYTTPRGSSAVVIGGTGSVAVGAQFVVNGSTITVGGSGTMADAAAAINAAGLAGIAADTNANGNLVITCYMPVQAGGLVLANVSGQATLAGLGLNAGTFLPPTPPKAFATAYSDQTSPVCLTTDQITISATDGSGTVYGPVTATLNGGGGTGWPADVAASISAALSTAGILSSDFTALSAGSAIVAVRAVGSGANQGVQLRNTAGGTLTLADADGTPLETLGIAPGTYQPGGYSPGAQTVFMAAEDAIAPGGRGVFVGGVSNATDLTAFPHTPFEARGGFLHGIRLDHANFNDNNAIVVAPGHAIAWGSKGQGQHVLSVSSGTLAFDGAPLVSSAVLDTTFGSEVGDMLVRTAAGWAALTPGAQGQVLGANGPGTPLGWIAPEWTAGAVSAVGTGLLLSGGTLEAATLLTSYTTGGTYTYTPRATSSFVRVTLAGGGGGGGSGFAVAAGTATGGGGGGGGGSWRHTVFRAADLAGGVTVTVGAGGAGGVNGSGSAGGATAISTPGGLAFGVLGGGGGAQAGGGTGAGGGGGGSWFNPGANASGATGGAGGGAGNQNGGNAGNAGGSPYLPGSGAGGGGSTSGAAGNYGGLSTDAGGGGGAGGGVDTSGGSYAGGRASSNIYGVPSTSPGGAGGGNASAAAAWFVGYPGGFAGAGGGGASGTTNGGNGSAGVAGGGGGGGGSCQSGATPGAGGAGGNGLAIFEEW